MDKRESSRVQSLPLSSIDYDARDGAPEDVDFYSPIARVFVNHNKAKPMSIQQHDDEYTGISQNRFSGVDTDTRLVGKSVGVNATEKWSFSRSNSQLDRVAQGRTK